MAASLSIEEESGTYTARFSHPHNGYYAGDFSQPSQAGSELRTSYTECRPSRRQDSFCGCNPGHLTGVTNPDRSHSRHQ